MKLVETLKNNKEDFEWYPTTEAMIACVKKRCEEQCSVLDCGAGDGRVLNQFEGEKFAIEKSRTLIKELADDIIIAGTDFWEQSLIDKKIDVIFCNPPYSEYEAWAVKIIKEADSKRVFLILPERWERSVAIQNCLELRKTKVIPIGKFDFLNADRQARAKVEILEISFTNATGAFDTWFEENFKFELEKKNAMDYDIEAEERKKTKENIDKQIIAGGSLLETLTTLYNQEMEKLKRNFTALQDVDSDLLKALNVDIANIKTALKQRIDGLKNKYWEELFDNYDPIIKRLTQSSRNAILSKLRKTATVEFTKDNIYAITLWVIKNANKYFDLQLVHLVEQMISKANTVLYKSNQKVYTNNEWYYARRDDSEIKKYGLELRVILERIGGFNEWRETEILEPAITFLNDIIAVANNLGFPFIKQVSRFDDWEAGKPRIFYTGCQEFMKVTVYKTTKTIHIKFRQEFMKTLNVEFGRLKGWLKQPKDAETELNIKDAKKYFNKNQQITASQVPLLEERIAA